MNQDLGKYLQEFSINRKKLVSKAPIVMNLNNHWYLKWVGTVRVATVS